MIGSSNCVRQQGVSILGPNRSRMIFYSFDEPYCQRLRDGDAETGQHFVRYFGPLLLTKLRRRVRSAALIDEIRQETFLRTFRALRSEGGLRQPEHLGAFVHAVCDNTMREYLRADSRTQPMLADREDPPAASPSAESELITDERKRMVRATIERMTARDQKVLRSVFFEERDKEEICRELGVDRGYLRVLLHRAKTNFRAILGEKDPSGI
jgi:RNA polymerase sigma-70 factor, ECF subfamily